MNVRTKVRLNALPGSAANAKDKSASACKASQAKLSSVAH